MKKLLMLILIVLLVILGGFIVIQGFEVGSMEVLSYVGIQDRSNALDEKIQEASKLIGKEYKQAVSTVESDAKQLQQKKQNYEEKFVVNTDGTIDETSLVDKYGKYKIETLWVKLGNHATKEGATMKMEVRGGTPIGIIKNSNNKAPAKFYDLNFTVSGDYISILEFVSDIENDSELGFKIEEFRMLPATENLQATFICRDIAIEDMTQDSNVSNVQTNQTTTQTNTTNNTTNANTSNTTTNANTSNTATNTATGTNTGTTPSTTNTNVQ